MKKEENWAWQQDVYGQEKLMLIVMARQSNGWIYRGSAAELSHFFGEPGNKTIRKAQRIVSSLLSRGLIKKDTTYMTHKNQCFILNYTTYMTFDSDTYVAQGKKSVSPNEYIDDKNINNNNKTNKSNPLTNPSMKVSLKDDWATIMSSKLGKIAQVKLTDDFIGEVNSDFSETDLPEEAKKFCLYWTDGKRKLKNFRLAWRNWLDKNRRSNVKRTKPTILQRGGQTKDPFEGF